jgi:hypothetical protein
MSPAIHKIAEKQLCLWGFLGSSDTTIFEWTKKSKCYVALNEYKRPWKWYGVTSDKPILLKWM